MSPEECAAHRSRIGFDVEIVLSGYWQERIEPELKAAILADWADELEEWPQENVRWALREWRRDNPRRKPNPGDIRRVLMDKRGREAAAKLPKPQPAPAKETVTPERAAEILALAGFKPRTEG